MPRVQLRAVTPFNFTACLQLQVDDDQKHFVDPNWLTLLSARLQGSMVKTIYGNHQLVGLLMAGYVDTNRERRYTLHRLMIDRRYQGQGFGRGAMEKFIAQARRDPRIDAIWLRYGYDNHVAARLYRSLGFEKTDEVVANSIVARLLL